MFPQREQNDSNANKSFLIAYNFRPGRTDIDISAFPVEICVNQECIQQLLLFGHGLNASDTILNKTGRIKQMFAPYIASLSDPTQVIIQ
jgi:hypothetical protein